MYSKDKTIIIDRREMLRVKAKSLAVEARLIRREEQRIKRGGPLSQYANFTLFKELQDHRAGVLRHEARATHLAYGLLKGRTIEQMEPKRYVNVSPEFARIVDAQLLARVRVMFQKYGTKQHQLGDDWRVKPLNPPLKAAA